MRAYARQSYLPNQVFIDLRSLIWTNPNNIMNMFSPVNLFDAFCSTIQNSMGRNEYDFGHLYDWVAEEMGPNGNPFEDHRPLVVDSVFVTCLQNDTVSAFCSFITNNRLFIESTLAPILGQVRDSFNIAQDDNSNVIRFEYL